MWPATPDPLSHLQTNSDFCQRVCCPSRFKFKPQVGLVSESVTKEAYSIWSDNSESSVESSKLRQCRVLFKRTCEFCGIQFTKHFIGFFFVETNEVVRSNLNVILMRQTCGHRSSRVAGSKRRALASYFSVRIWYMFLISIFRGKSDPSVCMTSVLAKRMRFRQILRLQPNTFLIRKSALRGRICFASTEVMHTPRSEFPLHIDIKNIYLTQIYIWAHRASSKATRLFLTK